MSQNGPSRPRTLHEPVSIAIVASLYNNTHVQGLLDSACEEINEIAPNAAITVYRVPGAFEIPVCIENVLRHSHPDAVIAFGVIIRGATEHGDLVGASVTDALQKLAVRHCTPVVHEVLLVSSEQQATERCHGTTLNRGTEAARVAVQMISLFRKMSDSFAGETGAEDF